MQFPCTHSSRPIRPGSAESDVTKRILFEFLNGLESNPLLKKEVLAALENIKQEDMQSDNGAGMRVPAGEREILDRSFVVVLAKLALWNPGDAGDTSVVAAKVETLCEFFVKNPQWAIPFKDWIISLKEVAAQRGVQAGPDPQRSVLSEEERRNLPRLVSILLKRLVQEEGLYEERFSADSLVAILTQPSGERFMESVLKIRNWNELNVLSSHLDCTNLNDPGLVLAPTHVELAKRIIEIFIAGPEQDYVEEEVVLLLDQFKTAYGQALLKAVRDTRFNEKKAVLGNLLMAAIRQLTGSDLMHGLHASSIRAISRSEYNLFLKAFENDIGVLILEEFFDFPASPNFQMFANEIPFVHLAKARLVSIYEVKAGVVVSVNDERQLLNLHEKLTTSIGLELVRLFYPFNYLLG